MGSRLIEYPFVIQELRRDLIPAGGKILLVGCAGDILSTMLPALGYETYGLDVKFVTLRYPNFHFVRGDVRRIQFPENCFDVVIAVSTIEHVGILDGDSDGDMKAMREILRVTKPDGIVIVTCPVLSRGKVTLWERTYDPESLKILLRGLTISKMFFFRVNKDGYWTKCSVNDLPTNGGAIALVNSMKASKETA